MLGKVRVEIAGNMYTLNTNESEAYVHTLANELSEEITALMERNPALSMNDALVLCAIGYLDAYKKENANSDHIRSQLKEYLSDVARARMEAEEANRRADKLAREVEGLRRHG